MWKHFKNVSVRPETKYFSKRKYFLFHLSLDRMEIAGRGVCMGMAGAVDVTGGTRTVTKRFENDEIKS